MPTSTKSKQYYIKKRPTIKVGLWINLKNYSCTSTLLFIILRGDKDSLE